MPQYLVAIHHPDNYDLSVEDEAVGRDIDVLNEEITAAGIKVLVGGLHPVKNAKSLRRSPVVRYSSPTGDNYNSPPTRVDFYGHPPKRKEDHHGSVTDRQVRRLRMFLKAGKSLKAAALRSDMDEKTARKYRDLGKLPTELEVWPRTWRTRKDPFADVWEEVREKLESVLDCRPTPCSRGSNALPGPIRGGQLRTLQRRIHQWRGDGGPAKEVFFAQIHHPGRLGASDFTHMTSLGVTIGGQPFDHLVYHFVLTYSNWETATICFSESFESLSEGFSKRVWELGGVPQRHRTDRMSLAVNKPRTEGVHRAI